MSSRSTVPSKRSADAQEAAWVADEDRFVLQQSKKKAALRVKGGRAQPIDWLAVTLAVVETDRSILDDDLEEGDLDLMDPEGVFEGLDKEQLKELQEDIDGYLTLETSKSNRDYWQTLKAFCEERRGSPSNATSAARGVASVASDLDKLLGPKNLEELEKLERQIKTKLASNGPIDTDYWEHLLRSLIGYKAKAKLRQLSESVLKTRMDSLRKQQTADAAVFKMNLDKHLLTSATEAINKASDSEARVNDEAARHELDPEPMLRLRQEDKSLESTSAESFVQKLEEQKAMVLKRGYIPLRKRRGSNSNHEPSAKRVRTTGGTASQSNDSLFDREVARGLGDNEEIFSTEEPVETKNKSQWAHLYRPRKPKSFNRMQLGYEWNKYNQTHYDHDNPPPKVVQGYKFNVFYPDLVDQFKAPTYRIERENGRKRGQTFAPAGEDDTCLIRFTAGPPYEDIAFRIVDREWDFSAKRERGFRSSFDKGILQLHFQFKKIYYRK